MASVEVAIATQDPAIARDSDPGTAALRPGPPLADSPQPVMRRLIRVGPQRDLTTVAESARQARDGDTVEIDAGEYQADVATWAQNDVTIRAVGGMARMVANGKSAEGKAIWVIKGNNVSVENIAFHGARVPSRNGAGIRHEGGKLIVRGCLFEHNEMGILTWNSPSAELEVESSEFRDNAVALYQPGDPGHQIYVGSIRRFTLRASYVHRGGFGHLVKSRARENYIHYNRITDESSGRASYELEFPNGGIAYVVGNIIQQSAFTENEALISFGAEGYRWPENELYLVNNTLADDLPRGGVFLRVAPGAGGVKVLNNLFLSQDRIAIGEPGSRNGNFAIRAGDVKSAGDFDFRLRRNALPLGLAVDPGEANGMRLRPAYEYRHPLEIRPVAKGRYSPGAQQSVAP